MKTYKHLFFDLDHTLWDYRKNSDETLSELYDKYDLINLKKFSKPEFLKKFHQVNDQLWYRYNNGLIGRDQIRDERFYQIFSALGVAETDVPSTMNLEYLDSCPQKSNVIPFSHEVLQHLENKYTLHIITNGFNDIQEIKLKSASLKKYFNFIITSEKAGSKKPQKEIFEFAMRMAEASLTESIMIGDNLEADIIGARNACIDQVYFNPDQIAHQEKITYEIQCLRDLTKIL